MDEIRERLDVLARTLPCRPICGADGAVVGILAQEHMVVHEVARVYRCERIGAKVITPAHKGMVRWARRRGFDVPGGDAMALSLLSALARVGLCLDTATPGDEHLRLRTSDGCSRLAGFMVLHGLGPESEEQNE